MVLEGSAKALCPPPSLELQTSCNKSQPSLPLGSGSQSHNVLCREAKEPIKYGELIVLGLNGSLASGDKGRRRSRLALYKRPKAKPDVIHNVSTPLVSKVENEANMLKDGSLIDLCGATLLWRTPRGLCHTPTLKQLESLPQELNAARPQCPVCFNTLAFPSLAKHATIDKKQPWLYMNCGHVHGYHNWGVQEKAESSALAITGVTGIALATTGEHECPMCREVGPYVPLWIGFEGGLYLDAGLPTHAFCPCGHVCSEKTVQGWSQIPLLHGTHAFHAACPFCGMWLTGEQGHIKLIFQGPVD